MKKFHAPTSDRIPSRHGEHEPPRRSDTGSFETDVALRAQELAAEDAAECLDAEAHRGEFSNALDVLDAETKRVARAEPDAALAAERARLAPVMERARAIEASLMDLRREHGEDLERLASRDWFAMRGRVSEDVLARLDRVSRETWSILCGALAQVRNAQTSIEKLSLDDVRVAESLRRMGKQDDISYVVRVSESAPHRVREGIAMLRRDVDELVSTLAVRRDVRVAWIKKPGAFEAPALPTHAEVGYDMFRR